MIVSARNRGTKYKSLFAENLIHGRIKTISTLHALNSVWYYKTNFLQNSKQFSTLHTSFEINGSK